MYKTLKPALIAAAALIGVAVPAGAQEISAIKDGIHVIQGKGGNIGVSAGARDHTGGNENLGKAGVLIFAHDNVRERLLGGNAPAASLPVVTFNDTTTFHMNGQTIEVFHTEAAHTDGDAMIRFREANVIHMGDTFFNGFYPFIDAKSGGSVEGVFAAIDTVLAMADADTIIIPGHGPVGDRDDLIAYRDMLTKARGSISPLIADGKTVEDIVAVKPTAEFDAGWGGGFLNPERFIRVMHAALIK